MSKDYILISFYVTVVIETLQYITVFGLRCSATTTKDFHEQSFIEWDFQDAFFADMSRHLHRLDLQLMFRSRQASAILLKAQNTQKSEYAVLEVQLTFMSNRGSCLVFVLYFL